MAAVSTISCASAQMPPNLPGLDGSHVLCRDLIILGNRVSCSWVDANRADIRLAELSAGHGPSPDDPVRPRGCAVSLAAGEPFASHGICYIRPSVTEIEMMRVATFLVVAVMQYPAIRRERTIRQMINKPVSLEKMTPNREVTIAIPM